MCVCERERGGERERGLHASQGFVDGQLRTESVSLREGLCVVSANENFAETAWDLVLVECGFRECRSGGGLWDCADSVIVCMYVF